MNYLPGIVIIILISGLIGFAAHLIRGGSLIRMLALISFALIGFIIGQLIGQSIEKSFFAIGWVQAGWGSLFAGIVTVIGVWLTEIRKEE